MSIRWKFLIVLLVFSLTPLLAVTGVSQRGMRRLGATISDLAKHNRTGIVSKELQQTAEHYARLLGQEKEALELTLRIIARDAERFLSENPKEISGVYFAEDFDDPNRAPADLVQSPKHLRAAGGGGAEPTRISLAHQVFWIRPGVDKRFVATDIARLRRLLPLHKEFERHLSDILYWQYVSLESGVHAAYPGHGGYPSEYVPQDRPWFQLAKERNHLAWTPPYVDATTRQVIMTASMPVRRPDGSFAGVAAIDVLLSEILRVNELSSQWSAAMRSFLVWSGQDQKTGKHGLWVVAQRDHLRKSTGWSGVIEVEALSSSDVEGMNRLNSEIEGRKSGYLEMDHDGVSSVWAYAHAGEGVSLVLIVPKEIILAQVEQARKAVLSLTRDQWLVTEVAAAAVILIVILSVFWFSRAMIRPTQTMVAAVQRLAGGDFSVRMSLNAGDERDLVAKTFNEMVPQLEDRMHIRKALEVAHEIQQNLLPQEIPDLPGFDISAKSIYCDETGGDYFDFFPCNEEGCYRFGIAVGDVTGHGVGAALLMATARALIRALATTPLSLAECVTQTNNLLTADVRTSGNFMSLFFLAIESGSPTVQWVRAGHDPAILFDPATMSFAELDGPGLVLGVDEDYSYEAFERTIGTPGSIIVIGTDGIWESHNSNNEMFGKHRAQDIIRQNAHRTARDIQDEMLAAIDEFREGISQEDDVTVVVIKLL